MIRAPFSGQGLIVCEGMEMVTVIALLSFKRCGFILCNRAFLGFRFFSCFLGERLADCGDS